jgi:hypothetical protein
VSSYLQTAKLRVTVLAGQDRALNGDARNQRVDQVLASGYGDRSGRPFTNYLNPAAFALAPVGALGNMGRSNQDLPLQEIPESCSSR